MWNRSEEFLRTSETFHRYCQKDRAEITGENKVRDTITVEISDIHLRCEMKGITRRNDHARQGRERAISFSGKHSDKFRDL